MYQKNNILKTILITHADNEFGKSVAHSCVEHELKMLITGERKEVLYALDEEITEMGGDSIALVADLNDDTEANKLSAIAGVNFGKIDVVFHLPATQMPFSRQELWKMANSHLAELIPLCEILSEQGGGTILYFVMNSTTELELFKAIDRNAQDSFENLKKAFPKVNFLQLELKPNSDMSEKQNKELMEAIFYVLDAPKMLKISKFALDF